MKKIIITLFTLINLLLIQGVSAFSLDFEEVNYNYKSWNNESTSQRDDWYRTTSQHYNGSYSLQSGIEDDSHYSCFEVNHYFYTSGWIQFHHKESSQSGHDYLRFYVDGSQKNKWSGRTSWTNYKYNVDSGSHKFKWCYTKDSSGESGDDKVWVDNIRFQGVRCNPTWGDKDWRQTYSCLFTNSKKLHRNIILYNATIDIDSGNNMGIDLANYYIKFLENSTIGTSSIPSKINIPSDSKIDNSTSGRYYESKSYSSTSGMTSCPAGMYALKTDRSDYESDSGESVGDSGTLYCGN